MAGKQASPIDTALREARTAIERGDLKRARGRLQQAMSLLARSPDASYVGDKLREVRRLEARLRSLRRPVVAAPAEALRTPTKPAIPMTMVAQLGHRADSIESSLAQGRLTDARRSFDVLRQKTDVLTSTDSSSIRERVAELQVRLRKLEEQRSWRAGRKKARNSSKKTLAAAPTSFICDECKQPRPTSELVKKPGKRRVCVPCATGQVCPSCHRPKSPDFDLCIRCSGGGGKVKILYGGAFESNRRKH